MTKKETSIIGSWSFLIGVILAVIVGVFGLLRTNYAYKEVFATILSVAGLLVGLLNIKSDEVKPFLMAGTVLVVVTFIGQDIVSYIPWMKGILDAILIMFVPATIIVAIRHVFSLAKH